MSIASNAEYRPILWYSARVPLYN